MINLYNTLTKTKERLTPRLRGAEARYGEAKARQHDKIQMFVCGPTVYDYIHIGNARTFVFFDVVAKYLRSPLLRPSSTAYSAKAASATKAGKVSGGKQSSPEQEGYEVDYIQNITDIDDKIINKAKQENKSWKEIADFYFEEFKKDMKALGITSLKYIRATDRIEEVKKQVKKLIEKENVYLIEGDGWYFDLKTFPDYGKLSGRTVEMANDAVSRIDESGEKRNKGDFCVWKLADPEPSPSASYGASKSETGFWEDEKLGYGRPGWHIEDTAITESEFGPQYDIHGGGQDLIFPHHEAEIAQQESASGLKPFVKYWMHVAFLVNKEAKMSKSLGNFETVNELLKKYSKEVLRFYLLSGYYRQPLEFSDKILKQSEAGVYRIRELIDKLNLINKKKEMGLAIPDFKEEFNNALSDDFNTPRALAAIFELIKHINLYLTENSISKRSAQSINEQLEYFNSILGIIPSEKQKIPVEVQKLTEKREKFRQEKNYEESDKIRTKINDLGYEVEDTVYGPLLIKT